MRLKRVGVPALCSIAPRIMVTAWLVTGGLPIAGAAEPTDYLQVINEEAHKVEQRQPFIRDDTDNPNAATTLRPTPAPPVKRQGIDWQGFEQLLASDYRGTFTFYSDLSERSKEEIYEGYINGLDMDALREKVVTRYHHEHSKK